MEKIKDLRLILDNAICECCKNSDCETMEKIFVSADWTWTDHVTDEPYHPTARELRTSMYDLGKSALNSLMEKYEGEGLTKETIKPYTVISGRLFFTIDWEIEGEELNILRDVVLSCGISHEFAITNVADVSQNDYVIETFADDEEYCEPFDRITL